MRLEPATQWLRRLDWFTPDPGLWVGDANEGFLSALASAWADRPQEADYLGNAGFSRLFLTRRQLRPRIVVKGALVAFSLLLIGLIGYASWWMGESNRSLKEI